jgi:hypothetical protein
VEGRMKGVRWHGGPMAREGQARGSAGDWQRRAATGNDGQRWAQRWAERLGTTADRARAILRACLPCARGDCPRCPFLGPGRLPVARCSTHNHPSKCSALAPSITKSSQLPAHSHPTRPFQTPARKSHQTDHSRPCVCAQCYLHTPYLHTISIFPPSCGKVTPPAICIPAPP